MQITDDKSEIRYTAAEGQTDFIFDFPVYEFSDLVVYDGTPTTDGVEWSAALTLGTDYTAEHTDEDAKTGRVQFATGRGLGHRILIQRHVPLTQSSQYVDDDKLPAKVFEGDINRGIMIDQQHARQLAKCFKLADTSALENLIVPEPEAEKVLYWISPTEMGNKSLADLGAVALPLSVAQGGTGGETAEEAVAAIGAEPADADIVKADTAALLRAVYGDEAQVYPAPEADPVTDLSGLTINRNQIAWTLTADSLFSDVALPYNGTYVFHVYPGSKALTFAASYKTDGNLSDPDPSAGEIRIVVEQYNSRKSIIGLQNLGA
jgi:hypothetical protein